MIIKNLKNEIKTFGQLKDWLTKKENQNYQFDHYETLAMDWLFQHCNPEDKLDEITIGLTQYQQDDGSKMIWQDPSFTETTVRANFWQVLDAETWWNSANVERTIKENPTYCYLHQANAKFMHTIDNENYTDLERFQIEFELTDDAGTDIKTITATADISFIVSDWHLTEITGYEVRIENFGVLSSEIPHEMLLSSMIHHYKTINSISADKASRLN